MSEIQVASRYAKSLLDLAVEQNQLDTVKRDIVFFVKICKENSQLQAVLKNPIIGPSKKIAILENIFGADVCALVISFFKIVTNKGRSGILYATAKEFLNIYNSLKGIVKASIVSAEPLSESSKQQIIDIIKQDGANEVVLNEKVNPELIGGFILTVGDKQFDASISNKLDDLKKAFAQKVVIA